MPRRDRFEFLDEDYWVDHEIDVGIEDRCDKADRDADRYDPDDHEPMGGDPYWSEDTE